MSLIRLHNVSKKYGQRQVLRNVFFRLKERERVGLVGKNGVGKTTVLRLILKVDEPTDGKVEIERDLKIGYFSQFSELNGTRSIQAVLSEIFIEVHQIEQELGIIENAIQKMQSEQQMAELLDRYAQLTEQMEQCEGWTVQYRIDMALTKLGFSQADRIKPIDQLSGGWRNRAALAELLLQKPDVLLLDEPTNFLDFAGLAWVRAMAAAMARSSHYCLA